ncbi:glycosyltransferase family 2 protein (plasmid) [Paracoccus liaowanqingii]|uniref:Glycosyltransferase family 2 protein n=1 Tax=Paracoccus liaowanqingii TaxID=2560053 RepID=A0A4Y5STU8_9RHOB|nr:glycosyltransferase family 2 protein [Paracoccus liaowanqingii]QDA36789.1 glycosyltransferase family 2 protein [Paracoccus liaowanqingii]
MHDVIEEVRLPAPVARPRLAVVISCYNYERFIGAAIDSVLAQRRGDCEIVVVDDGSTDGSWQVIAQTRVNALRISNRGQVGACLAGFERTTAPFVLFLDADDILKPGSLAHIIDRLDDKVAKLQFPLTRIDSMGRVLGAGLPALEDFRDSIGLMEQVLRSGAYVSPPTSGNVFRRDICALLPEMSYDTGLDGVTLFAAPFFGDVVSLSKELGCYRVHANNMSGQGKGPNADGIRKDLRYFSLRMKHLRRILDRIGHGRQLARTEDMYFYIERQLCAEIASGRRPGLRNVIRLVGRMRHQHMPLKSRSAMTMFFLLATILPPKKAQSLLAYRFRFGPRSMFGFVTALIQRS